jgi:hypothetical protein
MRGIPAAAQTALEQNVIRVRDFIRFTVRDRDTGDEVVQGYWSDVGTVEANVINPETQASEAATFDGAGSLISVGAVPLVSNLSVQGTSIELSQVSDANSIVRQYDAKQGTVEVFRGLFEMNSRTQISAAYPRFFGFINEPEILTPAENEEGGITLSCVAHTQELTRFNPATRSDAYQKQRSAADTYRRHSATVGTWEIKWGAAG